MTVGVRATDRALQRIPGWFLPTDRRLFRWFLGTQVAAGQRGDLAELGVYLGQSATLIGDYLQPGETFTVIDLFEEPAQAPDNHEEYLRSYRGLTQSAFERNYLSIHAALPEVVRGFSQDITAHASVGTHRFVHVDASHLYAHVRADIAAARQLLGPEGVVVFDDIRQPHTPGVAAAVWQEVTCGDLQVLVVGNNKLYGTFSRPDTWLDRLAAWLPGSGLTFEQQQIAGQHVFRVARPAEQPYGSPLERFGRAVLPPVASQALRTWRKHRRLRDA